MIESERASFFSVSLQLILVNQPLPYDLFVNSSAVSEKERFVRIFPSGETLNLDDLKKFKAKYFQLYIPEKQRNQYLKSLVNNENATDMQKTEVIKESAIGYLDTLFDQNKEFSTEELKESVQGCRDSVESMVDVLQDHDISSIQKLIGDLSFHDFYTYDHSINVSMYNMAILKSLNPNARRRDLVEIGLGGLLHDLGKLKIPIHIINNPGKLSDGDFDEIKKHPQHGVDLFDSAGEAVSDLDLNLVRKIILEHHENYNGTGYPNKVGSDKIHLFARVTAIADFFDALTTKRSYHEVVSTKKALEIMAQSKGKKIDPTIFDKFVKVINDIIPHKLKSLIELPDDFDPCQPQENLPFMPVKASAEEKENFGKIKVGFTAKAEDKKTLFKKDKKKAS